MEKKHGLVTLLFLVIFVIAVGGLLKTQAFDQEGWKIRDQEQVAACYAQDRLHQAWGFDSATQRFCYPDTFAGMWIGDDCKLVIAVTDQSEAAQEEYLSLISGYASHIRFVQQEHGYNELLTIGEEIREYTNKNGENVILNCSVDETRNKVILWVDGSVSLKQLSRLIDEKYFGAPYILQHPEKTTLC